MVGVEAVYFGKSNEESTFILRMTKDNFLSEVEEIAAFNFYRRAYDSSFTVYGGKLYALPKGSYRDVWEFNGRDWTKYS